MVTISRGLAHFLLYFLAILDTISSQPAVGETLIGKCATFFKEEKFGGPAKFVLKDGSQVTNFGEEYVSMDKVWNLTRSLQVEAGCILNACNDSHFAGTCLPFEADVQQLSLHLDEVISAGCTCQKDCRCSKITMRRTSCGQAYLAGGCNVCHPVYTDLRTTKNSFSEEFKDKVTAIKVRDGCTLEIFPEPDFEGTPVLVNNTIEDWSGSIESYDCKCSNEYKPKDKDPRPSDYPLLIEIPDNIDSVDTLMRQEGFKRHPGLIAAKQSLKSRRSSRNGYILLLGSTGSGKSTTINLLFDNPNLTKVGGKGSETKDIHEFRIPVPVDELGMQNSELRVIDTPGLGDTDGVEQDAKFLATLDDYLSTHEELHDRIPNVVLIFHKYDDNRILGDASVFVKMLRGLDSFRGRITDDNYSNVIFVLTHFCAVTKAKQKKPKDRLQFIKTVIEDFSQFPKPIVIAVAENKGDEDDLHMVNGYYKLRNGEYYPKNLFDKIEMLTSSGEDPVGNAVIRTAFRDADDFNISSLIYKLISDSRNIKVSKYLSILINSGTHTNTEISNLLATSFENMNFTLKEKFPFELAYLQRALNIRNYAVAQDIPRTTLGILELLATLKKNEATIFLLEDALGLKAPSYQQNVVTGYSYNVFKDEQLPQSPYNLGSMINSDIGYLFPSVMSCGVENKVVDIYKIAATKAEYLNMRLANLGIEGSIPLDIFKGEVKPGFNIVEKQFLNDSCFITAVREFQTFELTLNDYPSLTPAFIKVVYDLPIFNESDQNNVDTWQKFFSDYGTHVVNSVHGGGSIGIQLKSNKACNLDSTAALFELIQFAEDLTSLSQNSTDILTRDGIQHSLTFTGGDTSLHTADLTKIPLSQASQLLRNWKKSLRLNPTILTTEMKLLPMSTVVKKLGHNISSEIQKATSLLFNSTLIHNPIPISMSKPPPPRIETSLAENKAFLDGINKVIDGLKEANIKLEATMQKQMDFLRNMTNSDREQSKQQAERQMKILEEYQRERQIVDNAMSRKDQQIQKLIDKISCLKRDALILMADMSHRPVEDLVVGDLVMDHTLTPTRVVGVSKELLMTNKFYGFDKDSYFFTHTHMFVGPGSAEQEPNKTRIYAKNIHKLFETNPLMEYMDVQDMNNASLFKWNPLTESVASKSVQIFEDPSTHPEDTLVYFIQVESPSGTYFANGFACRHEIPPIEIWPNTMDILFFVFSDPNLPPLHDIPYTLKSVKKIDIIVEEVWSRIEEILMTVSVPELHHNRPKIVLEDGGVEKVLGNIYNYPSFSAIGVGIYAKVGKLMASFLGSNSGFNLKLQLNLRLS